MPLRLPQHSLAINPIRKGGKGGSSSGRSAPASRASNTISPNPATNPKAAAPLSPPVIAKGQQPNFTETFTLATTVTQGNSYNLPTSQDVIGLQLQLSGTVTTPSAGWDAANVIQRIEIYNGAGSLKMNIPGGTFLYDQYTRFSGVKPTAVRTNTVSSSATTFTATIQVIGLRLPAANGCNVTIYYNTLAGTASSAAAVSVTNAVQAIFGSSGGHQSRMRTQTFSLNIGDNLLQTNSVPQGVAIYEVFMRGWSSIAHLDHISIESGTAVVEQNLKEAAIVQRMTDLDLDSYETTTLVLREPGPFIMDANGLFNVNCGTADTPTFTWYWVE
jgi:hypothetical protein